MKIWKATVLIAMSDEYSKVQANALGKLYLDLEEAMNSINHDFAYVRANISQLKEIAFVPIEEPKEFNWISDWQTEADSQLDKLAKELTNEA